MKPNGAAGSGAQRKGVSHKGVQMVRLAVQIFFFIALATSLIGGFMSLWGGILIAVFLLAVAAGNFYCGWMCPFGSLQEWLGKLGSRIFGIKLRMPAPIQRVLQFSRYIVYGIILLGSAIHLTGWLTQSSSFNSNYHFLALMNAGSLAELDQIAGVAVWIFLGLHLAAALFFDRPFCNYLCPDGVQYGFLSFARIISIRRREGACVGCGRCSRACPMQIDVAKVPHLRHASCINCMECFSACPVPGALSYGSCLSAARDGRGRRARGAVGASGTPAGIRSAVDSGACCDGRLRTLPNFVEKNEW